MRESNAIAKPLYVYGPFAFVLVAFIMAASSPLFLVVAIAVLYFIGLSRLMISKLSLFRDGIWFSFGPGPMIWQAYCLGHEGSESVTIHRTITIRGSLS